MQSSFFEFNVAVSGLFAAKNGLSVTMHNVTNMSTRGYSRQNILQKASIPLEGTNGVGMYGTGTNVYGIGQTRDFYLDKKYWNQESVQGEYSVKNSQLELLETVFNEMSGSGVTKTMTDFFNSLSGLTFSADEGTYRNNVIDIATKLAADINSYAASYEQRQSDINEEIYSTVKQINSIGDQIVSLNKQIDSYEIDGSNANDLRDQRAVLIDDLAKIVNIDVKETELESGGKKMTILINGQSFVDRYDSNKLTCIERKDKINEDDVKGLYDICWGSESNKLSLINMSGELKGMLDIRDGNEGVNGSLSYKGIPYYMNKLNTLVRTVAKAINEGKYFDDTPIESVTGHVNGYDKNGNKGGLFFTYNLGEKNTTYEGLDIDYNKINASNFSVSSNLVKNPSLLACSDSNDPDEESNNNVILGFLKIKENDSLFKEGNVFDFINGTISELAIDKKQAGNFDDFYTELTQTTDNQRISVSGVSLNEEIAALVKYQQLYQAASKMINTIDQIYNTTINGLGV